MTPNVPDSLSQLPVAFTYCILAPRDNPLKQIGKLIFSKLNPYPSSTYSIPWKSLVGIGLKVPGTLPALSLLQAPGSFPPPPREYLRLRSGARPERP